MAQSSNSSTSSKILHPKNPPNPSTNQSTSEDDFTCKCINYFHQIMNGDHTVTTEMAKIIHTLVKEKSELEDRLRCLNLSMNDVLKIAHEYVREGQESTDK